MKNKDKILKYLSGLMNKTESEQFLNEIEKSENLRKEYEKITGKLKCLELENENIFDESYFINLIPKVRNRLEEPSKSKLKPQTAYAITLILAILITSILLINKFNKQDNKVNFITVNEIETMLYPDSTLNESLAGKLLTYDLENDFKTKNLLTQLYTDQISSINDINLQASAINLDNTDLFQIMDKLSEDEFKSMYKSISSTKILR